MNRSPIDWESPTWGQAGHNVHESSTGSWVPGDESGQG
jgi:hypothetical protein